MKLGEMGLQVSPTPDGIWAQRPTSACTRSTSRRCRFPGFATDFMPMAVALLSVADGTAIVTENVFDNRFTFVDELDAHGRRRPHRRPARGGARRGATLGRPGDRRSTCAPARRWCSPASPPTARPGCTTASTSIAATPTSPATLRALGADVDRLG